MRVHFVGTGLIGGSLALALTRAGHEVTLSDQSPTAAALARDLGAGRLREPGDPAPEVVVVATPPDVTGGLVISALTEFSEAVVMDVASVKGAILREVSAAGKDIGRYVGAHPMAGRERSGVAAARADLFEGRAFAVVPSERSLPDAVDVVRRLGRDVGGAVVTLSPAEHDVAVAAVSHVPQIASSLVAARLEGLAESAIALSGQGIRDVTRIAASDAGLWTQILSANAAAVTDILRALQEDLNEVVDALDALADTGGAGDAPGSRGTIARAIAAGNSGQARLPGKHGGASTAYATLTVLVPDRPGELGRLFNDVGAAGVNLEDLRLEHGMGQAFGLAEIFVVPGAVGHLRDSLEAAGWTLHG